MFQSPFVHGNQQTPQSSSTMEAPHFMPSPTNEPWNLDDMPWVQQGVPPLHGEVMQFQAHTNTMDEKARRAYLHQKRKLTTDFSVVTPPKQFISEEKITAHFNGLHISSDYIQHTDSNGGKSFTNLTYQDYKVTAKELEEKLRNANRITLCEDLRKLHENERKVSLLPEALINRIQKPCTALVLWQPPPIIELMQQKEKDLLKKSNYSKSTKLTPSKDFEDCLEDVEFSDSEDIDDFIDNNNTCSVNFNNLRDDDMEEDI